MALLTRQNVAVVGDEITLAAADVAGDTFAWDARGFLWVHNGSAGEVTVTVAVPGTEYGQPRADVAVPVPAGADRLIGPLVRDLADPTDGLVAVTYSAVASVSVAVVSVPNLP